MFVLGLTGGVGTGKSTVAGMLEKLGAVVLDADRISHALMEPGTAVSKKIRSRFGPEVFTPAGRVDRRQLAQRVFRHPGRLKALCGIIHPAVRRRIERELTLLGRGFRGVVVLDVPLLFEAKPAYRTDAAAVVSADARTARERLVSRSGWSRAEAARRSRFQMPLSEKRRRADFVIDNGGSRSATRRQVLQLWKKIGEGVHGRRKDGGRKDGGRKDG